jgi:hypothetical protein
VSVTVTTMNRSRLQADLLADVIQVAEAEIARQVRSLERTAVTAYDVEGFEHWRRQSDQRREWGDQIIRLLDVLPQIQTLLAELADTSLLNVTTLHRLQQDAITLLNSHALEEAGDESDAAER